MSKQIINNGDSSSVVTNKINGNFSELQNGVTTLASNSAYWVTKFDYFNTQNRDATRTNFGLTAV